MNFGISLPNRAVLFGVPVGEILDLAVQADEGAFFDSVWVGDNLFSRARMESVVLLSAIAARTERVRIGTVCMASFPMRQPLLLSVQWASLDRLAEGRTILAVCLGDSALSGESFARELAAMGIQSAERVGRLEEGVEILRATWAGGPASHEGRFYSFSDIEVLPRPMQQRPPIMIAANPPVDDPKIEERSLRRIARLADGWQTYGHSPELVQTRWERIQLYAAEYGRADEVTDCSMHLMLNIGADVEACREDAMSFFRRYYGDEGEMHTTELYGSGGFGPPEVVARTVAAYRDSGTTRLILRFASLDQASQMRRFTEEVAPAVLASEVSSA
jgi:alkanesulfonate monooxygenase SsuD/methylene tetrahydromethanopterin reductase-like flavin-dependent oxidoreductase (luciferase family)